VGETLELRGCSDQSAVQRDDAEHEEERGEQPAGAARPERRQCDASLVAPLGEEQAGDEKPG
jgi:hypothetical protein